MAKTRTEVIELIQERISELKGLIKDAIEKIETGKEEPWTRKNLGEYKEVLEINERMLKQIMK